MNLPKYLSAACCVTAAVILLASCGASHQLRDERMEKDVKFGFEKLRGRSLLVAGTAMQAPYLAPDERARLGSVFSNMLIAHLEGAHAIRITGTGRLISAMGLESYSDMMTGVDQEGGLSHEDLPLIESAAGSFDYILLALIVNENVIDYEDEEYVHSADNSELRTDYKKRYFLTIDFQLYDTKHEKMVWSNVIFNEAKNTESRTTSTGFVESCMSNLIQSLLFGSPAEISREEVLDEMVERFTRNLQRVKSI
jgi:hypothetical protein